MTSSYFCGEGGDKLIDLEHNPFSTTAKLHTTAQKSRHDAQTKALFCFVSLPSLSQISNL